MLDQQDGSALILALVVLMVVALLTAVTLSMIQADQENTKRDFARIQSFYTSEAGIEVAREALTNGDFNDPVEEETLFLTGTVPNAGYFHVYIKDDPNSDINRLLLRSYGFVPMFRTETEAVILRTNQDVIETRVDSFRQGPTKPR